MSDIDELQQLKRYIVQTVAHMTAKGIKTGIFEDWTAANEIYHKVEGYITQYGDKRELEALKHIDAITDKIGEDYSEFDALDEIERYVAAELKKQPRNKTGLGLERVCMTCGKSCEVVEIEEES